MILFRDLDRPECLFGFTWGPVGIIEDDEYFEAVVCWANFDEMLYAAGHGLPKECSPEGINWI